MSHFLITGHTGFKGSWLTLLLRKMGHTVSGIALDPEPGALFDRLYLSRYFHHDIREDIRRREPLISAVRHISPDYVVHFAAQALVLEGYRKPAETYETNVMGTLNVLLATEQTDSVRAQLIVTTDKVYRNDGSGKSFSEDDPLGGHDPYSASKALADLLAQERLSGIVAKPGAIARAGNVIGAGDHSAYRLLPDLVRSIQTGVALSIRNPEAVRPWQHVLDCLNGYLTLLSAVEKDGLRGAWNFGPPPENEVSVGDILRLSESVLEGKIDMNISSEPSPPEAPRLTLNSAKARHALGWKDKLGLPLALDWALADLEHSSAEHLELEVHTQISKFIEL